MYFLPQVQYAHQMNFSGVMFWSMDLDDFNGDSCGMGRYPLLSAIRDEVKRIEKQTSGATTDNSSYKPFASFFAFYFSVFFFVGFRCVIFLI